MINKKKILIINNCPAFYKINLYNKIAEKRSIFVVFLGLSSQVVSPERLDADAKFPFKLLNTVQVEQRKKISTFFSLLKLAKQLNPEKIIYGGYIMPELLVFSYIFSKSKNILQTETASETSLSGIKLWLKKIILQRFGTAVASGSIHREMLLKMGFSGEIIVSGGVGIINKLPLKPLSKKIENPLSFIFVGRLIEVKNVRSLIAVFNKNRYPLTIVGDGELASELKSLANNNITFMGFIKNNEIADIYREHDVFVLPSLSEPWGLVVEEALYNGCVVMASSRVGAASDLIVKNKTGCTFDPGDENSMQAAVDDIINNFLLYKKNVDTFNLENKDRKQVEAYLNL